MQGAAVATWIGTVTRAPKTVLAVAALVTALAAWLTVVRLGVDTDPTGLFADDLRFQRDEVALGQAFPQFSNTLVLVLDGPDARELEDAARELAERLVAETGRFRTVFWPRGDPFFAKNGLLYLPLEELRETVGTLLRVAPVLRQLEAAPDLERLATLLARAIPLAGSELPGPLVRVAGGLAAALDAARTGEVAVLDWRTAFAPAAPPLRQIVVAQPSRDYESFLPSGPAIELVRTFAADLGLAERGVRLRLTGDVALAHDELEEAGRGAAMAGVLSLLLVGAFLFVGLRSKRLVAAALVTLLVGLTWTAGWAALTVGHLNLISVAFAVLYISLGVDFSIHLGLRVSELRAHGLALEAALAEAGRDVGSSLLLAALTTSLGFAAFVPTDFTGVAELGVIAGGGMLLGLAANLTVLPALLSLHGLRPRSIPKDVGAPGAFFMRLVQSHDRRTRQGALLLGALALCTVPWVRFDANPLHLRSPEAESVQTFHDLAAESETTPYVISVLAPDAASAARIADAVEVLEPVAGARRIADFVPVDQEPKLELIAGARATLGPPQSSSAHDRDPDDPTAALEALRAAAREKPALAPLAASVDEFLLGLEDAPSRTAVIDRARAGALGGLPAAIERLRTSLSATAVDATALPDNLRERWVTPDGTHRVEVVPREDLAEADALQEFADRVLAVAPHASGGPVIVTESARVAAQSFRSAFLWALGAMAALLLLVLRSARDVVLILMPLALAGVLTVAILTLAGVPFNFANVIGLPLLLGMSVDNGIHTVHRFRTDPEAGAGGLLRTSTARAVLFSSLTTLGGFGTLVISPHPGTASLGLLLCTGILANLACTLVLLPVLLARSSK